LGGGVGGREGGEGGGGGGGGGGGKEERRGGIRLLMKQLGNVVGNAHASAVALRSRCNIYELILSGRE